jgi:hypothetical protein
LLGIARGLFSSCVPVKDKSKYIITIIYLHHRIIIIDPG